MTSPSTAEAGPALRDVAALTAYFAANGYPPPHPLSAYFRSYVEIGDSIAAADVVVPVIVRQQTGEIIDGIIRCERLCEQGVPWNEVLKRVLDLPTDSEVAECIAQCNLDRRHDSKSQMAIQAALLGLAEPMQGARTDSGKIAGSC